MLDTVLSNTDKIKKKSNPVLTRYSKLFGGFFKFAYNI